MSLTFIDTNKIPHSKLSGSGEFAEVLNGQLCGAKNVVGSLRWLNAGEKLDVRSDANTHQLVYLMQGEATITMDSKDHGVKKTAANSKHLKNCEKKSWGTERIDTQCH